MVDEKLEMNNDSENYAVATNSDPKNVQELTQYVSGTWRNLTLSPLQSFSFKHKKTLLGL